MRRRLVLLHGFTQTGRSWGRVADDLADQFDVVCPDMPGHAGRPHDEANLWEVADSIVQECGPATYIGYSMGARVALHAALSHPDAVERFALLGCAPGIRDADERLARVAADETLARSLETDGVEDFLDRWLANPLFANLPTDAAQKEDRLRSAATGLAMSLRRCGTGVQENLWPRVHELRVSVLVMAGALDTKFAAIAREMAPLIGRNATLELVPNAGHAAHLEQHGLFVELVRDWLGRSAG